MEDGEGSSRQFLHSSKENLSLKFYFKGKGILPLRWTENKSEKSMLERK